MNEEKIAKMRQRAENCRKLALTATDPEAKETLEQIADEIEVDVIMLESARQSFGGSRPGH